MIAVICAVLIVVCVIWFFIDDFNSDEDND